MTVYGYPQPGKAKSEQILVAFCQGARGYIARGRELQPGAAAFYGMVGIEALFRQAQAAGDWYYIDNAYFDRARGRYFRVSRNALQRPAARLERRELERLAELGIPPAAPWRLSGKQIVIVEQSDYFMREVARWNGGLQAWRDYVVQELGRHTDRPLIVRRWQADKAAAGSTLAEDLAGAWAVVAHSSAAANEALMAGIPVFVTGQCVAAELGNRDLSQIEAPVMPDDCRDEWAARLAASQWRLDEMRDGVAWRALQDQSEEVTQ